LLLLPVASYCRTARIACRSARAASRSSIINLRTCVMLGSGGGGGLPPARPRVPSAIWRLGWKGAIRDSLFLRGDMVLNMFFLMP
jgi:hypothetical protein